MQKHDTRPILDLEYPCWTRTFGDITAIGSWTLDDDRPCIVLVPTFKRPDGTRVTPCVIRIDDAYLWTPETGDPTITAPRTAAYADALGFSRVDPGLLLRIFGIIEDCLSDLLRMPNLYRQNAGEAVADVIARDADTGKTIHEGTVYDV
jgi:hypothetical protein